VLTDTAYGVETDRFNFANNVSQFEFWDSYLPQYEMAFREGEAAGAMCSYLLQIPQLFEQTKPSLSMALHVSQSFPRA
jgi:hypothetical protein